MFNFFISCLSLYGVHGIVIYLKIKLNLTDSVSIPGIAEPISLRKGKTDRITFREIFIRKEYHIDFPSDFKPGFIVDAGANIGLTTVVFANRFPDAKIISIEPDDDNFRLLQRNTSRYRLVTPIRAAIWKSEEMVSIEDHGFGERGFMISQANGDDVLQATTVDTLMKKFNVALIDILKMDIEGSEREVFSGNFHQWLPNIRCLIIELHDRMKPGCSKAVLGAINQYNFSLEVRGDNLIFYNQNRQLL